MVGNERPRKLACYSMERERLAEITVEPADLVTHLIAKVKTVLYLRRRLGAPRPFPMCRRRLRRFKPCTNPCAASTRVVCAQALNGTIAGRPFRLRRGEDGWKQKPSPIVKRQVPPPLPSSPVGEPRGSCGDLTNLPSPPVARVTRMRPVRPAGVRGLFGGGRLRGRTVWRCALPQSPGHACPRLTLLRRGGEDTTKKDKVRYNELAQSQ
jgi:hypothetical protein